MNQITHYFPPISCPNAPKVKQRKKFLDPERVLLIALSRLVPPVKTNCVSVSQFCHFHKASIEKLTRLDLSNLELSIFPESLAKILLNLRYLDLSGNRFNNIPPALRIVAAFNNNPTIILSDNPIGFDKNHTQFQIKELERFKVNMFIWSLQDGVGSDEDSLSL
jgi:hypothetical protein